MKNETIVVQTESLEDELARCREFEGDARGKDIDEAIQRQAAADKAGAALKERLWQDAMRRTQKVRVKPSDDDPLVDSYGG